MKLDGHLESLYHVLNEFGISSYELDNRREIQCTVHLFQYFGDAEFGYRFGWYTCGPYCHHLNEYIIELDHQIKIGDLPERSLKQKWIIRIEEMKPMIEVPEDVDLEKRDWLNLLAGIHYLELLAGKYKPISREDLENNIKELRNGEKMVNCIEDAYKVIETLEELPEAQSQKRKRSVAA